MKRPEEVQELIEGLFWIDTARRVSQYVERLEAENERLRKALKEHECPGDGSIDQACYDRIIGVGKCSATEALNRGKES